MPESNTCGKCGAAIAIDALMGLCGACLFNFATQLVGSEGLVPEDKFGKKGRGFSDYQLGRQIGRGGMGVVYEATQSRLSRQVALKMIVDTASSTPAARHRFAIEAETVARLDHPN